MSDYESALAEPISDEMLALLDDWLNEKSTETLVKEAEHSDEPALRTSLLRAWKAARMGVSMTELGAGVRKRDVDRILLALSRGKATDRVKDAMLQHVAPAFLRGANAGARAVGAKAPLRFNFGHINPKAGQWARARAAELVKANAATRERIRALIDSAVTEGITVDDTAELISEFIGLDDRRADTMMAEALRMHHAGKVDMDALTRRAEELLMSRANTIARTEILMATNAGQQAAWDEAKEAGMLTGLRKLWIATDNCCDECEFLSLDDPIDIDEEFGSGSMDEPVMFPPLHPNCRCTVGLTK